MNIQQKAIEEKGFWNMAQNQHPATETNTKKFKEMQGMVLHLHRKRWDKSLFMTQKDGLPRDITVIQCLVLILCFCVVPGSAEALVR